MDTYVDLPLGGTDASVVAMAERYHQGRVASLYHRHLAVVRPTHVSALELVRTSQHEPTEA